MKKAILATFAGLLFATATVPQHAPIYSNTITIQLRCTIPESLSGSMPAVSITPEGNTLVVTDVNFNLYQEDHDIYIIAKADDLTEVRHLFVRPKAHLSPDEPVFAPRDTAHIEIAFEGIHKNISVQVLVA